MNQRIQPKTQILEFLCVLFICMSVRLCTLFSEMAQSTFTFFIANGS